MSRKVVSGEELIRRLLKLLRKNYEEPNWQRMHGGKAQSKLNQINYELRLIKAICKRRSINVEIIVHIKNM
jgi:ribosomal protein L39E